MLKSLRKRLGTMSNDSTAQDDDITRTERGKLKSALESAFLWFRPTRVMNSEWRSSVVNIIQPRPQISRPRRQSHHRRRRQSPPAFDSVVRATSPRYSTLARGSHRTVRLDQLFDAPPAYSRF